MNPTFKKFLTHIIAYLVLMAVAFIRFAPVVFEGKTLQQGDNIQAMGMQAEIRDIAKETGEFPLWTNSMFSGMPAYQILYASKSLIQYVFRYALLGNGMAPPHTALLLLMAGFYLLRDQNELGLTDGGVLPGGPHEIEIVFQDRMFSEDGEDARALGCGYVLGEDGVQAL